jgi:hypothetical protein
MAVIVMVSFSRSGGTVLNQCLGSLPNVLILSEVNPLGGGWGRQGSHSLTTVKAQAKHWYGVELGSDGFVENILELEKVCLNSQLHLVVRDWPFVNFVPYEDNHFEPSNTLLTLEMLERNCDLIPFVLVRDSIDVWISLRIPMRQFFRYYLRYVEEILAKELPFFKYEDFCDNPGQVLREICTCTGLQYSNSYQNYASFDKVNGDVQFVRSSRGMRQAKISKLPRKRLHTSDIIALNGCDDMIEANRLLGYPTSYWDTPLESYGALWARRLDGALRKFEKLSGGLKARRRGRNSCHDQASLRGGG